jgi:hypothetical protein
LQGQRLINVLLWQIVAIFTSKMKLNGRKASSRKTRLNTKKGRKLVDVLRRNLIPRYALRNIICWDIFNRDFLEMKRSSGYPLSLPKELIIEINPSNKNMEQSTYNYITSKNVSYLLNSRRLYFLIATL